MYVGIQSGSNSAVRDIELGAMRCRDERRIYLQDGTLDRRPDALPPALHPLYVAFDLRSAAHRGRRVADAKIQNRGVGGTRQIEIGRVHDPRLRRVYASIHCRFFGCGVARQSGDHVGSQNRQERVHRKLTRPVGWILFVVGVVLWLGLGLVSWFREELTLGWVAGTAVGIGVAMLVIGIGYEQYREWKSSPYKDVLR